MSESFDAEQFVRSAVPNCRPEAFAFVHVSYSRSSFSLIQTPPTL